jgi:pyruvate dehydrogenase (quinone)/pyruvate oxidase
MTDTAAGILLDTMQTWGVDVMFGLPGDGINGLMEALRKRQDRLRFIQVRHEEAAAFMACGYARYTGRLGACLATSGPGGIHLLSGLYDAKIDRLPVVAVSGHHYHDVIGTYTQQDVDLDKLFQDVAVYSERVMGPAHAENVAHIACRDALGLRGVAHINVPTDIQSQRVERRSPENVAHHQSAAPDRTFQPSEAQLRRAAEVLGAGSRVALLCGPEVDSSDDALVAIADRLGAPIIAPGLGRAVFRDDAPYAAGCLGLLGCPGAHDALVGCDTLFLVGAVHPASECLPAEGLRVVQLVREPGQIDLRYAVDASLIGEIAPTLQALLPLLRQQDDRQFLGGVQQRQRDWLRAAAAPIGEDGESLSSARLAREIAQRLNGKSILYTDRGHAAHSSDCASGPSAVPCGLPYVIAAQIGRPDHQCVAVLTESNFAMLMPEFVTAVKYRLPIRVVVVQEEDSSAGITLDLAGFAQACGGAGFLLRSARECSEVLDCAFAAKGPALIGTQLAAPA